ncbi:MAG: hypothetical protein PWQ95_1968 [Thermococcaceae archaeon]|nr:hypothetical protein [Thermococcaceae archaeon]
MRRHLKCIRNILILLSLFFSLLSIYKGFRNNNKALAGLGLFALSFWLAWYDPVTREISKKTNSTPKTPGEISADLTIIALLILVIVYTFLYSPSGTMFLAGLITLAILIILLSRLYTGVSEFLNKLSKKYQYVLPTIFALTGIISILVFRNIGGISLLLGFLASALIILEFERRSP